MLVHLVSIFVLATCSPTSFDAASSRRSCSMGSGHSCTDGESLASLTSEEEGHLNLLQTRMKVVKRANAVSELTALREIPITRNHTHEKAGGNATPVEVTEGQTATTNLLRASPPLMKVNSLRCGGPFEESCETCVGYTNCFGANGSQIGRSVDPPADRDRIVQVTRSAHWSRFITRFKLECDNKKTADYLNSHHMTIAEARAAHLLVGVRELRQGTLKVLWDSEEIGSIASSQQWNSFELERSIQALKTGRHILSIEFHSGLGSLLNETPSAQISSLALTTASHAKCSEVDDKESTTSATTSKIATTRMISSSSTTKTTTSTTTSSTTTTTTTTTTTPRATTTAAKSTTTDATTASPTGSADPMSDDSDPATSGMAVPE
eukprot:gnl/TRDRNA2_/TRDRNA2_182932_c0_seq1.p1 gnl/TRDRNA2_/TRDRNA2_182932_c0~~gnl/TRDRNA2_/TRDRNA2_182932_c0_seq1.p1  ORF type:complete len:380 (+),score=39.02 gnl/TRDRNA2_/TRDRNA2_182932_c0_seq1:112-1251(+)